MERITFCYPDSFLEPGHFGVAARVSALVAMAAVDGKDPLDDYIEAHVHGPADLGADLEALVLDPCYLGTAVEEEAGRLDPAMIGDASRTGRHDEQALKRVWHYVARFGSLEMRDARAGR